MTVAERTPLAWVRTSGHATDLFGPAMDVVEWTGVLPAVLDARTRTEIVSFQRTDGRGVDVEMRHLVAGISRRHVEVMRGELATILYEATPSDPQYLFEDSIHTINQEPEGIVVKFEHAPADRFDLVIGADGLHSIVRRLVFGPEDQLRRFLGVSYGRYGWPPAGRVIPVSRGLSCLSRASPSSRRLTALTIKKADLTTAWVL